MLFFLYKIEKLVTKNVLSQPSHPRHNSRMCNMLMFTVSCFSLFFRFLVSSLLLIDFYFSVSRNKFLLSFQLTFSLLFNPLISLFTFVRCEYRAQCFFFSLFLLFFLYLAHRTFFSLTEFCVWILQNAFSLLCAS